MALHEALQRSFDRDGAGGELNDSVATMAKPEQPGRGCLSCPASGTGWRWDHALKF